jgi:hypothetical protein
MALVWIVYWSKSQWWYFKRHSFWFLIDMIFCHHHYHRLYSPVWTLTSSYILLNKLKFLPGSQTSFITEVRPSGRKSLDSCVAPFKVRL